jgi:hypothetical protein
MSNDLAQILEKLKSDYLANLPPRIAQMEELWLKSEHKLLKTEFHKLKGTGKTYGLPEISELGLIAEDLCQTEARTQAVPVILDLLHKIHSHRINGKVFDLGATAEFQKLTAMRKAA